ncbi:MAG: two-partner secretion domain-containing protein, partial [Planctomycetota bacterium]
MKKVRRISNKYYVRQIVACWMVLSMVVVMPVRIAMAATPVITDDGGANVTQNNAIPGSGWTNIEVVTPETIMASSNFNTAGGESVNFSQLGVSNAAVLNRISGGQTTYDGILNAEAGMSIYLLNPAGIVFGGGSMVNVTNLVASSLNMSDGDFLAGNLNFTNGADATGPVEFHGTINGPDGPGFSAEAIALIGKTVLNTGTINADYVAMAAGNTVTISEVGGDIAVVVTMPQQTPGSYDYRVRHDGGSINAEQVVLAAGDIWSSAYISASDLATSDAVATVIVDAEGDVAIT